MLRSLFTLTKCPPLRKCTVLRNSPVCSIAVSNYSTNNDQSKFLKTFETTRKVLTNLGPKEQDLNLCLPWFEKVLDYNVKDGKMIRGLMVPSTYNVLTCGKDDVKEEQREMSRVLGWTVEYLQAFYLVSDDVMDCSITRRGKPCWYKNKGIGLIAFNDAELIKSALYQLMKIYIRGQPFYTEMLELLLETTRQTNFGQCLDLITPGDFSVISLERQQTIVKYKTSFYTFCLPVRLALYLAEIGDPSVHEQVEKVLLDIGQLFQAQDDFIDCYGDPKLTGKVGTDIQDAKCTWLIATAVDLADGRQLNCLRDNYGKHAQVNVETVKSIYDELALKEKFHQYETDITNRINQSIESVSRGSKLPKEIFEAVLQTISKRTK
ncbi:Farnesyl pyrophosphate synthase [Halotydeus destructor]|nr:Farnesyl pyrophosphate synthase [Halotydeus destructor]